MGVILLGIVGIVGLLAAAVLGMSRRLSRSTPKGLFVALAAVCIAMASGVILRFEVAEWSRVTSATALPWLAGVGVPAEQLVIPIAGGGQPSSLASLAVLWVMFAGGVVGLFWRRPVMSAMFLVASIWLVGVTLRLRPEFIADPVADQPFLIVSILAGLTLFALIFLRGSRIHLLGLFAMYASGLLLFASQEQAGNKLGLLVKILVVAIALGMTALTVTAVVLKDAGPLVLGSPGEQAGPRPHHWTTRLLSALSPVAAAIGLGGLAYHVNGPQAFFAVAVALVVGFTTALTIRLILIVAPFLLPVLAAGGGSVGTSPGPDPGWADPDRSDHDQRAREDAERERRRRNDNFERARRAELNARTERERRDAQAQKGRWR